jgi:transcription elongation factor Elf1
MEESMNEIKRLDILSPKRKCYNCGNRIKFLLKIERDSWSTQIKCKLCEKTTQIIISDKMSGAFTDTVIVYSNNHE